MQSPHVQTGYRSLARAGVVLTDITEQTIPEDFSRNKRIHHCYIVKRYRIEDACAWLVWMMLPSAHARRSYANTSATTDGQAARKNRKSESAPHAPGTRFSTDHALLWSNSSTAQAFSQIVAHRIARMDIL